MDERFPEVPNPAKPEPKKNIAGGWADVLRLNIAVGFKALKKGVILRVVKLGRLDWQ